jgi:membrane protease YdiL (CAAX protease family)
MRLGTQQNYIVYLLLILAGMVLSWYLLSGPLKQNGQDLGAAEGELPGHLALVILAVTVYGAHLAARFLSDPGWRRTDDYVREVGWSLLDILAMLLLFMTAEVVYSSLASDSSQGPADTREFTVGGVLAFPAAYCVVLLFSLRILRQRGASFAASMGLTLRPYARLVVIGVIAFLAFQPLRLIHTSAAIALFNALGLATESHPVVEQLSKSVGMGLKLSLIFSVGVSAPLFEEIFFRGFFYQALRRHIGAWAAIALTGTLFAAIHTGFFQVVLIFPLGLLLTYLMEKTGSIIPSIVLHFLVNGTSLLVLLWHGG